MLAYVGDYKALADTSVGKSQGIREEEREGRLFVGLAHALRRRGLGFILKLKLKVQVVSHNSTCFNDYTVLFE